MREQYPDKLAPDHQLVHLRSGGRYTVIALVTTNPYAPEALYISNTDMQVYLRKVSQFQGFIDCLYTKTPQHILDAIAKMLTHPVSLKQKQDDGSWRVITDYNLPASVMQQISDSLLFAEAAN